MMNSVIVKVQKGSQLIVPKFRDCLVRICDPDSKFVKIRLKLRNDSLIISCDNSGNDLLHSTVCPFQELESGKKLEKDDSNIPVAVSVILESSDNHILMTRRPSHMRSSPNVWVPPGGHLELGESLIVCGLRELFEETGIQLTVSEIKYKILCIWENVFPIMLGFGEPRTHVLVVYFHVKCSKNHNELNNVMHINPEEVQAYAWLNPKALSAIFNVGIEGSEKGTQFTRNGGRIEETELDYLQMFNRGVWISRKMFSGVQASLFAWLKQHEALYGKL